MPSPSASKRQRATGQEIGSAVGMVGGAALSYKGVKGVSRAKRGATEGKKAYKYFKDHPFNYTRKTSASAATKVGVAGMRGPKTGPTLGSVGAGYIGGVTGGIAGGTAGVKAVDARAKKKLVTKREKPLMSEAEQRRRQKLQGKIGRTTSTLGLTGVGLAGAGVLAAKKPGALKALPGLKKANPEKLKNAAFHTGIISGGIGGVGGFNQASIYSAEARRRNVKKSYESLDMGYNGEQGTALPAEEIEKAWEPTTKQYDPEAKRHARAQTMEIGAQGAAGGLAGGAAYKAGKGLLKEKPNWSAGQRKARHLPSVKAAQGVRRAAALKSGKAAAGLAAGSAAAAGGAALIHHGRKSSWKSYSKRDTMSAFGVDHSDNPNGQHRETEN